ncbi:MAG: UMP kinase [Candidatus Verstraetearchaeota archaeon]|nr:UMP kinase [Candidatus Verstraetearchaeota archaeon]
MKITIKLSGHILFPAMDTLPQIKDYATVIRELVKKGDHVSVVVGGGAPARYYIQLARREGADEATCDHIGITIANLNAKIFSQALGDVACPFVPMDFDELEKAKVSGKVIVMGGLQPGQSTNAVACILAEKMRSELLINTTTVDGVYSSDPKRDQDARRLETVTVGELSKILASMGVKAGEYALLDPVALRIIQRSRITTKIIDGRDPLNILRACTGEKIGTTIIS